MRRIQKFSTDPWVGGSADNRSSYCFLPLFLFLLHVLFILLLFICSLIFSFVDVFLSFSSPLPHILPLSFSFFQHSSPSCYLNSPLFFFPFFPTPSLQRSTVVDVGYHRHWNCWRCPPLHNEHLNGLSHQVEFGHWWYDWIDHKWENDLWWFLNFSVVSPIFFILINRNTLLRVKCKGNAQMYAETRWEMSLKSLGDHLGRT